MNRRTLNDNQFRTIGFIDTDPNGKETLGTRNSASRDIMTPKPIKLRMPSSDWLVQGISLLHYWMTRIWQY